MFDWFKKKQPTVVFEELVPGIKDLYPPILAVKLDRPWMNRMRDQYKQVPKEERSMITHVARCPGIHKITGTGFIVRTWQDITIHTSENGTKCHWDFAHHPSELAKTFYSHKQEDVCAPLSEIEAHPKELFSAFFDDWPKASCDFILKYNAPWLMHIPKGYNASYVPIPYSNETRFTILPGVVESEIGPITSLNVFLRWNVKEGSTLIPAGTPLYQLHVYKNEKINHSIVPYNTATPHPYKEVVRLKMGFPRKSYEAIRKMFR
jgi:hypothetical protein